MKLRIERNSWILKVAGYGGLAVREMTDLCSIFWCFLWGVIRAPFWVLTLAPIIAGAIFVFLVNPIIGLIAFFSGGLPLMVEAWAPMIGWAVSAVVAYEIWAQDRGAKASVSNAIDIVRAGYRSWKEKTCVLIDVA